MIQTINIVIGILSLTYFVMYGFCVGLTNTFTFFWMFFGVVCLVIGINYKSILRLWSCTNTIVKGIVIGFGSVVVVLIIFVMAIIINYGTKMPKKGADYVIVLGAQVKKTTPSYNLSKRLDKAYEYLKFSPKTKVIVSGGQGLGEDIPEAIAMEKYLVDKGIEKDRIIVEKKSINTYENIKFSREIIKNDNSNIVIVTSAFHVYRGVGIAKKQGFKQVEGLGSSVKWYTVPNMYLREALAVIKYYICGQI